MGHRSSRLRMWLLGLGLLSLMVASLLVTSSRNTSPGHVNSSGQVPSERRLPSKLQEEWDGIRRSYAEVRWQYFPGLRLTREKKEALWNRVLEHALLEHHWWDGASGTVVLRSVPFDSEYTPEVKGVSFEMIGEQELLERVRRLGRFEYVNVWHSFETPASIRVTVSRSISITRERRRNGERDCRSSIPFRCRRDWGEWRCEIDRAGRDLRSCDGPLRPGRR